MISVVDYEKRHNRYLFFRFLSLYSVAIVFFIFGLFAEGNFTDESNNGLFESAMSIGMITLGAFGLVRFVYLALLKRDYLKVLSLEVKTKVNRTPMLIIGKSVFMRSAVNARTSFEQIIGGIVYAMWEVSYSKWEGFFSKDKNATTNTFMVLSFNLPAKFPHIYVNGKNKKFKDLGAIDLWLLRSKLSRFNKKIDLEGDFAKYFSVYAAVNKDRDVLRVLTPDVMQSILMLGGNVDVEIVDNQVNVFIDRSLVRTRSVKDMARAVESFVEQVTFELKRSHGNWDSTLALEELTWKSRLLVIAKYAIMYAWVVLLILSTATVGALLSNILRSIVGAIMGGF